MVNKEAKIPLFQHSISTSSPYMTGIKIVLNSIRTVPAKYCKQHSKHNLNIETIKEHKQMTNLRIVGQSEDGAPESLH